MSQTALILGGSGKIGTHAARAFRVAGWNVRLYRRDTDMTAAAQGADVIVNGLNPPNYHNWARIIPEITAQVIAAARASGATVIIPGNVYNFGDTPGTWDEHTPHRPTTRKGRIREDMERAYRAAGIQTIVLRAGNFIDPDRNKDIFSMVMLPGIGRGRLVYPGKPGTMQAYAWLPDWAKAAVMLAEKRGALGLFEDVPLGGLAFSAEELRAQLQGILDRPVRITGFPWLTIRMTSPFWELARELLEMRYLWNTDHRLSERRLKELLPEYMPTPLAEVLRLSLPGDVYPDHAVPGRRSATA